jgi:hypothetical protein
MYGPSAWFIIYTADVRMRSEHFDRLGRYAERDHERQSRRALPLFRSCQAVACYFQERPCGQEVCTDQPFFLTRVKTASESVLDGMRRTLWIQASSIIRCRAAAQVTVKAEEEAGAQESAS